ncbi:MAG: trans-sulfuration enzyme family protein [Flavobacteriales bacterium]
MNISEIINQLGEEREHYFNAVSPPIMASSNFSYSTVAAMRSCLQKEFDTPFYSRGYNPTVAILRKKIAALESTEDALICGSGSAAVAVAVISQLKAGDHVVCVQKPYSWTYKLLQHLLSRYGVSTSFIDGREIEHFREAIRPETKMIFLESPNSMTFELQDIEAVCALAKEKNIITIIDNSYSSPLLQKPAELGVDLIVHSATKYLNGHSDVVAGVICGSHAMIRKMMAEDWMTLGPVLAPHDAWLLIRGLRTLEVRMKQSVESTQKIVERLAAHPKIERMIYPYHVSHPQFTLAQKQMKSGSGMFSVCIKADNAQGVERFCDALQHFLLACSWGGYESLAFPVCALQTTPSYDNPHLPWNLVRIYIGLEDSEMLLQDLLQALDKV